MGVYEKPGYQTVREFCLRNVASGIFRLEMGKYNGQFFFWHLFLMFLFAKIRFFKYFRGGVCFFCFHFFNLGTFLES